MTQRRWIADEVSGDRAILTGEHADHLIRVLRARVGQEFDIAAGGELRRGRIAKIEDGQVEFELGLEVSQGLANTKPAKVTILLAVFKFDRMEWAIEKCTELGVSRIVPVISRRTDAHLAAAAAKRSERWRRIVLQAAEQSRRSTPPDLGDPIRLQAAIVMGPAAARIVLAETKADTQLRDALLHAAVAEEIILATGPEGGWTEDELQLFQQEGWIAASLGPTILRAETAAIAGIAITMSELGA